MNVLVLCGGQGSRLGYDGQKCCVPMPDGRPFLLHRLEQLVRGGATQFHLLISHRADDVFSALGHWDDHVPINLIWDEGTGPWNAVKEATRYVHAKTFWVANGDTWLEHRMRGGTTPMMVVTTNLETEPANIDQMYLDCGLYHVNRDRPTPTWWTYDITDQRPFTMNTPAQLEDLHAHLRGYRESLGDRDLGEAPVG